MADEVTWKEKADAMVSALEEEASTHESRKRFYSPAGAGLARVRGFLAELKDLKVRLEKLNRT